MSTRIKIIIRGAVQGVGFRPFIYRLAQDMKLFGFVYNSSQGVFIEAENEKAVLEEFIFRIENEKPKLSFILGMEFSFLDTVGYTDFRIIESDNIQEKSTIILPDIAVCKDCLREMNDPSDRRFNYPFINCTNCGPRFSIIEALPYDRPNTSMKEFIMCELCRAEYENPSDRRFHAQPIACPNCGPKLEIFSANMEKVKTQKSVIEFVADKIRDGKIIALKGLGGYQIITDARNNNSVKLLRERKHREEKPFALMFPSIEMIGEACNLNNLERRILESPESPIVLLKRKNDDGLNIAESVAPQNPYLGIMLPYTPIHHLLLQNLNFPLVATSGNISEEPICISEKEAFSKLGDIADYFLVHDRQIIRQVDDSIVRIVLGRETVLRRARGYSPLPVKLKDRNLSGSTLAVGAHLKNTVAINVDNNVFVSQHIGDLSNEVAYNTFLKVIGDFEKLYDIKPSRVISDEHPGYLSTKFARSLNNNPSSVQHHFAHVESCRAENEITGISLGIAWDGTGFGMDNTIWGGEFFISDENNYQHIGQFRQFLLPGGEKAIKEGRRSAIGVLFEIFGNDIFQNYMLNEKLCFKENELQIIKSMLNQNINSPKTSSVGRLFDAVSAILGISQVSNFEAQSAMRLEFIADNNELDDYPFKILKNDKFIIDWKYTITALLDDMKIGTDVSKISAKFHNTLAKVIHEIAEILGEEKIVLSGGCFQNKYLIERIVELLEKHKYKVHFHQRVPTNDGGISLGQTAAADIKYSEFNIRAVQNSHLKI